MDERSAAANARVSLAIVDVPGLKLVALANQREHFRVSTQRKALHRHVVTLALQALVGARERLRIDRALETCGVEVEVCRSGPRKLDAHDNLPSSCKHVVDAVAAWLCVDDADQRVRWRYAQQAGPYGVLVSFHTADGDRIETTPVTTRDSVEDNGRPHHLRGRHAARPPRLPRRSTGAPRRAPAPPGRRAVRRPGWVSPGSRRIRVS